MPNMLLRLYRTAVWMPVLMLPIFAAAQNELTPKSGELKNVSVDTLMAEASQFVFAQTSTLPDTARAFLRVRIFEKDGKLLPVQGATVLLRRDNDKMLGRVTRHDGSCYFSPTAASYTVRVQMTGLKTFEKSGFALEAGKVYDMDVSLGRN